MTFWSWWWGGAALAAVALIHMLVLGRTFAVSGRYTALVDGLRFHERAQPAQSLDAAELIAALRECTAEEFGAEALAQPAPDQPELPPLTGSAPQSYFAHLIFFGGILLGAALSVRLAGDPSVIAGLRGAGFASVAQHLRVPQPVLLLLGGALVGFGTRMAGGCTSGHGLCGVSQRQPGSLVATAAFFASGVATSFALGALL